MTQEHWNSVLSRIIQSGPVDLDTAIFKDCAQQAHSFGTGTDFDGDTQTLPPSGKLWNKAQSCIGVRVNDLLPDCTLAATRMAAAALERGVTPIVLTTLPDSGFERFGFRVERLIGDTVEERAIYERELMQFWNMAIVIDVADIAQLG